MSCVTFLCTAHNEDFPISLHFLTTLGQINLAHRGKDILAPLRFLTAVRSQNGSNSHLGCYSLPFCRFATLGGRWQTLVADG